jgi:hypothetical protein
MQYVIDFISSNISGFGQVDFALCCVLPYKGSTIAAINKGNEAFFPFKSNSR